MGKGRVEIRYKDKRTDERHNRSRITGAVRLQDTGNPSGLIHGKSNPEGFL